MPRYRLLSPFRVSDEEVAQPGTEIDLEEDVAKLHPEKLQRLDVAEAGAQPTAHLAAD